MPAGAVERDGQMKGRGGGRRSGGQGALPSVRGTSARPRLAVPPAAVIPPPSEAAGRQARACC
jgi:hypothetical protein